jgi:hypothetical protein
VIGQGDLSRGVFLFAPRPHGFKLGLLDEPLGGVAAEPDCLQSGVILRAEVLLVLLAVGIGYGFGSELDFCRHERVLEADVSKYPLLSDWLIFPHR